MISRWLILFTGYNKHLVLRGQEICVYGGKYIIRTTLNYDKVEGIYSEG